MDAWIANPELPMYNETAIILGDAMIDPDVKLGRNVKIYNPEQVNLFGCTIEDESFVGPFVEITRGVHVGKRCKIESHAFLCTGVTLEDEVFVGHGVMFTNDLYPRVDRQIEYRGTLVETGASLGSNATIVGGVKIGRYAVVGAGCVVTKDVPPFSIVSGNPGRVRQQFETPQEILAYMESRQRLRT